MRRTVLATLALASAFAAAAPAASAAPPWSVPGTVPGSQMANPFTIAMSLGNGDRGALGYTSSVPPASGCTQIASVAGVGNGAPGSPRSLSPYDLAAPPVAYANIHSILVQRRTLDARCTTSRLAVSFASLPGTIGTRRILDESVTAQGRGPRGQREGPGRDRVDRGQGLRRAARQAGPAVPLAAPRRRALRDAVGDRRQRQAVGRQRRLRRPRRPARRVRAPVDLELRQHRPAPRAGPLPARRPRVRRDHGPRPASGRHRHRHRRHPRRARLRRLGHAGRRHRGQRPVQLLRGDEGRRAAQLPGRQAPLQRRRAATSSGPAGARASARTASTGCSRSPASATAVPASGPSGPC